jgi:5-(carboxyamino)imidazole ribonucleotide mutase
MLLARLLQHRQRLAQRCHGAGHQRRADRLHPIAPEQLQQLQQPRQVAWGQFREGQAQAAVDLQIHRRRTDPVALPVVTGGAAAARNRLHGADAVVAIQGQPPAAVGAMAAAARLGQAHVADPAHRLGRRDNASILRRPPLSTPAPAPLQAAQPAAVNPAAAVRVAVVMGSDSDLPTMQPAVAMLERFGLAAEVRVLSAHRTPLEMVTFAQQARRRGLQVIIAGAGGAAHLPGMVASLTTLPVIGVPVQTRALSGVDSLHSIVQMPAGIPVATVAIGNGANAGLLAVQILAAADAALAERLDAYRRELHDQVAAKDARLVALGSAAYLAQMP